MVDKIRKVRSDFIKLMETDVSSRGAENVNIKFHGEVADIIKDLAEAEYYCTIANSMNGNKQSEEYSYNSSSAGYADPISSIRDILLATDGDTRRRIRGELGIQ